MASQIYGALDPALSEIRLLRLEHSTQPDSQIVCHLSKYALSESPEYHALSYTWGNSANRIPILVSGSEFLVTRNLFDALKRLRSHAASNFVFWIDAICIDQQRAEERNHQVQLMREIFSKSCLALIWLGEEKDDSDLAMGLITAWSPAGVNFTTHVRECLPKISDPFNERAWLALRNLFRRSYWKRMWILQEIVFSSRALVMCGSKGVSWKQLSLALSMWQQLSKPSNCSIVGLTALEKLLASEFHVGLKIAMQRIEKEHGLGSTLKLIQSTKDSEATDPRDKIYALLGFPNVRALGINPDYNRDVEHIYHDFVRSYIDVEGKLDILCEAGIGWPEEEPRLVLPSWVPDFRAGSDSMRAVTLPKLFAAAKMKAEVKLSDDRKALTTLGILFDIITRIELPSDDGTMPFEENCRIFASNLEGRHPTGIPYLQAYFRTIILDSSGEGYGPSSFKDEKSRTNFFNRAAGMMICLGIWAASRSNFDEGMKERSNFDEVMKERTKLVFLRSESNYLQAFMMWRLWSGIFQPSTSRERLLDVFLGEPGGDSTLKWPEDLELTRGDQLVTDFMIHKTVTTVHRALFISEKSYMGLAPKLVKTGDVVCVIPGCDNPLILRKIDDYYVLVGECYMYGIMNGEALEEVRQGRMRFEDIEIR